MSRAVCQEKIRALSGHPVRAVPDAVCGRNCAFCLWIREGLIIFVPCKYPTNDEKGNVTGKGMETGNMKKGR